ncbi:MAG TPA: SH3 domain-containing protein [Thermomicrobiales bacterium]|jgi:mannose-6-phosphate isomerase-like protein (cupin superfamily)/uncharacterized protein YjlB
MRRRLLLAPVTLLTVLVLGLAIGLSPSSHAANVQPAPVTGTVQMQAELPEGGLPVAPAFVLLRRINLDPGGSMPPHSHPGLAMYRVESGTLAVTVSGKAVLSRATTDTATPTAGSDAPLDKEFRMRRGDTLVTWAQTPKTYRNPGDRPTKVLAAFLLPAGHQHPPTISYLNGSSSRDIKGVTPEFLGDAVAPSLPTGPSVVTVDRLKLEAAEPIPAFPGPDMMSVVSGTFDFTTVSGEMQVSRSADQSVVANPAAGTSFSLAKGDAAFFPNGIGDTTRPEQDGVLQLLRLIVAGTGESATPVAATEPSVIQIAAPPASASPAATALSTEPAATEAANPTEATTTEPTAEKATATPTQQAGKFKEGDVVSVTDDGVNLRSAPSTDADVVTSLTAGQQLTITGPSEQGGDYTWWPVKLVDDESVTGYVAEDFIQLVQQ